MWSINSVLQSLFLLLLLLFFSPLFLTHLAPLCMFLVAQLIVIMIMEIDSIIRESTVVYRTISEC